MWNTTGIVIFALLCCCNVARADIVEVCPTDAASLPTDAAGVARVALRLDVSEVSQRSNVELVGATLEWETEDLVEFPAEFWVEPITAAWSQEAINAGTETAEVSDPIGYWEITSIDNAQDRDLVRLDLDPVINRWLNDPGSNLGLVVAATSLTPAHLARQMTTAKLVLRVSLKRVD